MAILYPVSAGTIVLCNYATGFREPEMIKRRPAMVISPRLPHRNGLCCVVPLSMTPPDHAVDYQVKIIFDKPLPSPWDGTERWAKADMLATVSLERLDLFRTERDQYGKRKYLTIKANPEQLKLVQIAVLHGLGLGALTEHL